MRQCGSRNARHSVGDRGLAYRLGSAPCGNSATSQKVVLRVASSGGLRLPNNGHSALAIAPLWDRLLAAVSALPCGRTKFPLSGVSTCDCLGRSLARPLLKSLLLRPVLKMEQRSCCHAKSHSRKARLSRPSLAVWRLGVIRQGEGLRTTHCLKRSFRCAALDRQITSSLHPTNLRENPHARPDETPRCPVVRRFRVSGRLPGRRHVAIRSRC